MMEPEEVVEEKKRWPLKSEVILMPVDFPDVEPEDFVDFVEQQEEMRSLDMSTWSRRALALANREEYTSSSYSTKQVQIPMNFAVPVHLRVLVTLWYV